jgi:hypothetical protein
LDSSRRHIVARDARGRCLCSRNLRRAVVEPGRSIFLYATFSPPPKSNKFSLQVEGIGSIPIFAR